MNSCMKYITSMIVEVENRSRGRHFCRVARRSTELVLAICCVVFAVVQGLPAIG